MHFKRQLLSIILILILLVSCSCQNSDGTYKAIKSSAKERTVFATAGEDVELRFELIRYLFYAHKKAYDNGDDSFWSTSEGLAAYPQILLDIYEDALAPYACFQIMKEWELDPDGENIEEAVNTYITADIEGGTVADQEIQGYGSYDAYKEALENSHSTDAVRRLFYQYSACVASLYSYICVNHAQGTATKTEEELQTFYASEDVYHFNLVYVPLVSRNNDRDEAYGWIAQIRQNMLNARNYSEIIQAGLRYSYSSDYSLLSNQTIEEGIFATDRTLNSSYDETLLQTIKTIAPGEVSDIIETASGFYVVYGQKNQMTLDDVANEILFELYYEEEIYKSIEEQVQVLKESLTLTTTGEKTTAEGILALTPGK